MKKSAFRFFRAVVLVAALSVVFYKTFFISIFYNPYVLEPKRDLAFLSSNPSRSEVVKYFGMPHEDLKAGERFSMTGWRPLPDRIVSHTAFAFGRRNGTKIYIFFGPDGRVEEFVIAHS